jgi:hypothetical protein
MIVENELDTWLRDRAAQRRSRAGSDAFAAAWNSGLHHRAFAEAMASLPERTAPAVTAKMVELLGDDRWIDALIEDLCGALRADPCFEPPFRHISSEIHSGLIVFEDDQVSLAAGLTSLASLAQKKRRKGRPSSIGFSGQVEILKFVRAGGARLSFWEAPHIDGAFTAAGAGRCRRTGERGIGDGEVLVVDGRHQSFVIEHASSNLLVLQATVKPDQAPLSVEYDSVTHEYVGCSAADDSASRIQMITTLLRKLDCAAAVPAMAEFLDHPNFFVRWHVMRELLGLDVEAALPHLKRMAAGDPHPETRRAARAVLDRLERPRAGARKAA